jgi:hypothetical protein
MRKSIAAFAAVALGATMTVVAAAGTAGASAASKETKCSSSSAKGIKKSWNQFLGAPTAAQKVKYVDQGAKIQDSVDKSNAAALAAGLTKPTQTNVSTSVTVTCNGKTKANFTFDLQFKDKTTGTTTPPLGLHQSGDAILKNGTWYISGSTVCDLSALSTDPASKAAVQECYQALGLQVPTS